MPLYQRLPCVVSRGGTIGPCSPHGCEGQFDAPEDVPRGWICRGRHHLRAQRKIQKREMDLFAVLPISVVFPMVEEVRRETLIRNSQPEEIVNERDLC